MDIYSKNGVLFYVQTDNLSGEVLGSAIEELYEAGAKNVQVVPTITKKNRPGHIFLIDTMEAEADRIEQVILRELRVTGWHRIGTEHRHLRVEYLKKQVSFTGMDFQFNLETEAKRAYGEEIYTRPEHRSCITLKQILKEHGCIRSLPECYEIIAKVFASDSLEYIIEGE